MQTTTNKLAALTMTAPLLSIGLASAETFNLERSGTTVHGSINDAALSDPEGAIQDAVLGGAKPKGGPGTKGGPGANGRNTARNIGLAFTCEAGGALLTLPNKGDAVPAGTKLRWEVVSLGERGVVRLNRALGNGATVRVDIGMNVDVGTPCAAKAI